MLIPLLAFPFQLFNSTLEENYDEVRGWFGLRPKETGAEPPDRQGLLLVVLLVAGGLLYALLSPDFGLNQTTLVSAVGLAIAVFVTGVGFSLPGVLYRHHHNREWGRLRVLPGTILVAAFTVAISRLLKFQPGYVYGLIATFAFRRKVTRATEGRLAAVASALILLLTLAAWIGRVPVSAAADGPHPGLIVLIAEVVLGGIFLLGLESLLIDLLPMRFLDGSRIIGWSRAVWAALFTIGLFALVHILLAPGSGYVGHTGGYAFFVVMALFVAFGLASTAFWAYFRYREPPPAGTAETAASL